MWKMKIKNLENGKVSEMDFSNMQFVNPFDIAKLMQEYAQVPYKCYIKWEGGEK